MNDIRHHLFPAGGIAGPLQAWVLLLAAGVGIVAFWAQQSQFALIATGFGLSFAGYALALRRARQSAGALALGLWAALGLRLLLLLAFPQLSDDIYRFVWDGRLTLAGYSPFHHKPSWYMEQGLHIPGIDEALYNQLNSPDYHTVYPPIAQGIFALAAALAPGSVWGAAFIIKLFLLLCDLGAVVLLIRLLQHWGRPVAGALVYALNPLVLVEGVGNLHFEVSMVAALLLAFYALARGRPLQAAGAWALAIAAKLLPLMFMPLLIRRLGWRGSMAFFALCGLLTGVLFAPLIDGVFFHSLGDSLQLYFRQFEFNASLYYLARWAGYAWRGHNEIAYIGPALATLTLLFIVLLAGLERRPEWRHFPAACLLAISVYLFNGTTVHPWYLILPVALAALTPWRYPLWWSGLATLSYIHYSYAPFRENYALIALEYGIVAWVALREFRQVGRSSAGRSADSPTPASQKLPEKERMG